MQLSIFLIAALFAAVANAFPKATIQASDTVTVKSNDAIAAREMAQKDAVHVGLCTLARGCAGTLDIFPGICQNFESIYNNQVTAARVPSGYTCTFFQHVGCSTAGVSSNIVGTTPSAFSNFPASTFENTQSWQCFVTGTAPPSASA
ncbi:hypothetical protein CPC08DRAFT_750122 [Agrocybe pediades]|nr:hypothetical protein CPC08DRAFT_750122 [Agrocybe pediades]